MQIRGCFVAVPNSIACKLRTISTIYLILPATLTLSHGLLLILDKPNLLAIFLQLMSRLPSFFDDTRIFVCYFVHASAPFFRVGICLNGGRSLGCPTSFLHYFVLVRLSWHIAVLI